MFGDKKELAWKKLSQLAVQELEISYHCGEPCFHGITSMLQSPMSTPKDTTSFFLDMLN